MNLSSGMTDWLKIALFSCKQLQLMLLGGNILFVFFSLIWACFPFSVISIFIKNHSDTFNYFITDSLTELSSFLDTYASFTHHWWLQTLRGEVDIYFCILISEPTCWLLSLCPCFFWDYLSGNLPRAMWQNDLGTFFLTSDSRDYDGLEICGLEDKVVKWQYD